MTGFPSSPPHIHTTKKVVWRDYARFLHSIYFSHTLSRDPQTFSPESDSKFFGLCRSLVF